MKTITTDFCYREQHFTIVYDGKFYMTVNHKFIGEDGRLVKELKYNDLHPGTTIKETISLTKNDLDIAYYESLGMSKACSFSLVMDVPMELAQRMFQ